MPIARSVGLAEQSEVLVDPPRLFASQRKPPGRGPDHGARRHRETAIPTRGRIVGVPEVSLTRLPYPNLCSLIGQSPARGGGCARALSSDWHACSASWTRFRYGFALLRLLLGLLISGEGRGCSRILLLLRHTPRAGTGGRLRGENDSH